jgi:hypothetical protein
MFIGLMRNGDTDTMISQISSDFTATISLVTHDATRTLLWTPTAHALDGAPDHQRFKSQGFMALARAQDKGHQVVFTGGLHMHFGAEPTLASPQGFGSPGRAGGMLMGANDGAIDVMPVPVESALGIGLLLDGLKEMLPDTGFLPAIEAAGHGAPTPKALGQIPPRSSRAEEP